MKAAVVVRRVLLGAAVVAAVGAVVLVRFWGPREPQPAPDTAAESVAPGELTAAAGQRVFLGHMSIGWNLLDGLKELYADKDVPEPDVVQVALDAPPPDLPAGQGAIVHAEIGTNGDPLGKIENFDTVMRGGMADTVDVALVKLCFTDITAGTDVDAVFSAYRTTMDDLERDFPDVRFVHTTVPLTAAPSGIKQHLKVVVRGDDNAARERYNTLVREAYGNDDLFDIAAAEGTAADGVRTASLATGWADGDREHLNQAGSAMLAARFLDVLTQTEDG
ncbi:hypothetical protein ASC64_15400 [Nocardioides sp. Root122]|uniref:hypothetical protein n=1 Tax=Nocardioides TaxID=1839 RepID=UPI0007032DB2|nr:MULTISPECIES: hypothetical protein [Nocardioides]KQV64171.1 hypothetical protein ASC64_15400 [Nocardioides sp. Root122]MCK9825209.1 hypothetical protein [Nocardioides cavernae]